jgi:DNA (cytosine-5)-methyltransferase 1
MKHFGDITKLNGADLPVVDCITGGSPCQDLSVAGKRAGLEGERSGLFMEQIRIVKEMREHDRASGRTDFLVRPRFLVWENVPGSLSSAGKGMPKGADFQAVLTEIVRIADPTVPDVPLPKNGKWGNSGCLYDEMGRWSVAWRIHNAQFWGTTMWDDAGNPLWLGTPQRRKRIAVVADFGGLSAPEILFERKGLRRNPEPSEPEREETAEAVGTGTDESSKQNGMLMSFDARQSYTANNDFVPTLTASDYKGPHGVLHAYTVKIRGGKEIDSNGRKAGKGALVQDELSGTLGVSQDQSLFQKLPTASGVVSKGNGEAFLTEEKHMSLSVGGGQAGQGYPCVMTNHKDALPQGADMYNGTLTGDVAATLNASSCDSGGHSGPSVVCLEGNGTRESHHGDGYSVTETMYTLNSTEQHAVAARTYRKQAHPMNSEMAQGYEETSVSDTLNIFDNTEARTPTLILNDRDESDCAGTSSERLSDKDSG